MTTTSISSDPHRSPGRPLDPAVGRAVLAATIDLVAERGYDRTTVEAIAARAGVGKPAIYRRWPGGKPAVMAAAILTMREEVTPAIDTGSLRGDLVALVTLVIAGVQRHAHLAAGLTCRLRESPELAAVFQDTVISEDRARFRSILERAEARGELSAVPAQAALLADLAPSIVLFRALVSAEFPAPELSEQLVDLVMLPAVHAAINCDERA